MPSKCAACNIKRALFNHPEARTPLYCGDCRLPDMKDIVNKKCISCGMKRPAYNLPEQSRPLYCGDCRLPDMQNKLYKSCVGCRDRRAYYNYPGQSLPRYCTACKTDHMQRTRTNNLYFLRTPVKTPFAGNKCVVCKEKSPSYNWVGERSPHYCFTCRPPGTIRNRKPCYICRKKKVFNDGSSQTTPCKDCLDAVLLLCSLKIAYKNTTMANTE